MKHSTRYCIISNYILPILRFQDKCLKEGLSIDRIVLDMKAKIKVSCHQLRHTMATQLLNAEAAVVTIQDLLGHNWITTTERYCTVSNLKVMRDYFRAMDIIMHRSTRAP